MMLLLIALILIVAVSLGYYAGRYFPPVIRILPPVLFIFWDPVLHSLSHNMTATFIVPVGLYLFAAFIGTAKKIKKSKAKHNLDWYILIVLVCVICILASIRPGPPSKGLRCQHNLKMIALAVIMYEQDNDKRPEAFSDITMYLKTPEIMRCPSNVNKPGDLTDVDSWSDYIFIPRDVNLPVSKAVIVYCPHVHNSKDVRNAAFADGIIDLVPLNQITGQTYNDIFKP